MEQLDSLSFGQLLGYLDVTGAARLAQCSTHLRHAVAADRAVWARWSKEHFNVSDGSFEVYLEHCKKGLARYRRAGYGSLARSFAILEAAFREAGLNLFLPGATEAELDAVETRLHRPLPLQVRASLRIHNGQRKAQKLTEVSLGWFSFYDACFALVLLGTREIGLLEDGVIVAAAVASERSALVVHEDEVCWDNDFRIADSWSAYLGDLAGRVQRKCIAVTPETGLRLFARQEVPTLVTRGIGISCSPLFVPSQSSREQSIYTFTYSICIFGAPDLALRAKLVSREWRIFKGEEPIELVRGPGVVGLYPLVSAGSDFAYESLCQCTRPRGWMEGHFVFRVEGSGEELLIPVPRFELVAPPVSRHIAP